MKHQPMKDINTYMAGLVQVNPEITLAEAIKKYDSYKVKYKKEIEKAEEMLVEEIFFLTGTKSQSIQKFISLSPYTENKIVKLFSEWYLPQLAYNVSHVNPTEVNPAKCSYLTALNNDLARSDYKMPYSDKPEFLSISEDLKQTAKNNESTTVKEFLQHRKDYERA